MRFYSKGIRIFALVVTLALFLIASRQLYLQWASNQLTLGLTLVMNLRDNIQPRDATASSVDREYQELRKLATEEQANFTPPGVSSLQTQYQTVLDAGAAASAQAQQAFGQHDSVSIKQADTRLQDVIDQWIKVRRLVQDNSLNNWLIGVGLYGLLLLNILAIRRDQRVARLNPLKRPSFANDAGE